jgi:hypothetical protein
MTELTDAVNDHETCVNIHGQPWPHLPAKIVGNRKGLERLRDLIEEALSGPTDCSTQFCPSDGEFYDIKIELTGDDWQTFRQLPAPEYPEMNCVCRED